MPTIPRQNRLAGNWGVLSYEAVSLVGQITAKHLLATLFKGLQLKDIFREPKAFRPLHEGLDIGPVGVVDLTNRAGIKPRRGGKLLLELLIAAGHGIDRHGDCGFATERIAEQSGFLARERSSLLTPIEESGLSGSRRPSERNVIGWCGA